MLKILDFLPQGHRSHRSSHRRSEGRKKCHVRRERGEVWSWILWYDLRLYLYVLTFSLSSCRSDPSRSVLPLIQGQSLLSSSVRLRSLSKLFAATGSWEGNSQIVCVGKRNQKYLQLSWTVCILIHFVDTKQEGQKTLLRWWFTWPQNLFWTQMNTKSGWRGLY